MNTQEIKQQLAALDELAAQLEGERDAIHAQIAADLFAPTTPHEGQLAGIAARLAAVPRRRAELEAQLAALEHEAELAQLEKAYSRVYALSEAADQIDGQIEALRAEWQALAARRGDLEIEIGLGRATAAQMRQRGRSISNEEASLINERWYFSSPRGANYAVSMRRRAATGTLPPGKTLADFGVRETEQEQE